MRHLSLHRLGSLVALPCIIAACGGGGSTPAWIAPTAPPSVAALTPTPTPTTATPTSAALVIGRVVDAEASGNPPIGGATVALGLRFRRGMLEEVVAAATTAPDGSYAISVPLTSSLPTPAVTPTAGVVAAPPQSTNAFFVEVDATGYVPYHNVIFAWPGPVAPSFAAVAELGPLDLTALAGVNADRARLGSGSGTLPLQLDSNATLTARFSARTEATVGFYSHDYPGTLTPVGGTFYCPITLFCGRYYAGSENEFMGGDEVSQEAAYIGEGPSGSHYQGVISPTNVWVGFGHALGLPPPGGQGIAEYAVQEYVTTTAQTPTSAITGRRTSDR